MWSPQSTAVTCWGLVGLLLISILITSVGAVQTVTVYGFLYRPNITCSAPFVSTEIAPYFVVNEPAVVIAESPDLTISAKANCTTGSMIVTNTYSDPAKPSTQSVTNNYCNDTIEPFAPGAAAQNFYEGRCAERSVGQLFSAEVMINQCPGDQNKYNFLFPRGEECTASFIGAALFFKSTVQDNIIMLRQYSDSNCTAQTKSWNLAFGECFQLGAPQSIITTNVRLYPFLAPGETRSPTPPTPRPTFATFSPVPPTTFAPVPAVTNRPTTDQGYIYAYYTNDPHLFRYKYNGNGQVISSTFVTCNGTGWRTFARSASWIVRVKETSRFYSASAASSVEAVQVQLLDGSNSIVTLDTSEFTSGWTTRNVGNIKVTAINTSPFLGQPFVYSTSLESGDLRLTVSRWPWVVGNGAFFFAPLNVAIISSTIVEGIAVDGCPTDGFSIGTTNTGGRRQLADVVVPPNSACTGLAQPFLDACNYDVFVTGDTNFAVASVKSSETFAAVKIQAETITKAPTSAATISHVNPLVVAAVSLVASLICFM